MFSSTSLVNCIALAIYGFITERHGLKIKAKHCCYEVRIRTAVDRGLPSGHNMKANVNCRVARQIEMPLRSCFGSQHRNLPFWTQKWKNTKQHSRGTEKETHGIESLLACW